MFVPSRSPLVTRGGLVSPGMRLRLARMPHSSRARSATTPLRPKSVTSMRTMWLSVPPVRIRWPRTESSWARARALCTISRAVSWKAGSAAAEPAFQETARLIVHNARALAQELSVLGHRILTGGTDNHMVLIDVTDFGLSGVVAERALEECGILANRNRIPGDTKPPLVTSGLRLGTNILAQRGMDPGQMRVCAQ